MQQAELLQKCQGSESSRQSVSLSKFEMEMNFPDNKPTIALRSYKIVEVVALTTKREFFV